jgi:hypothetical protein
LGEDDEATKDNKNKRRRVRESYSSKNNEKLRSPESIVNSISCCSYYHPSKIDIFQNLFYSSMNIPK